MPNQIFWRLEITVSPTNIRFEWEIGATADEARQIAATRWGVPVAAVASVLDAAGAPISREEQQP